MTFDELTDKLLSLRQRHRNLDTWEKYPELQYVDISTYKEYDDEGGFSWEVHASPDFDDEDDVVREREDLPYYPDWATVLFDELPVPGTYVRPTDLKKERATIESEQAIILSRFTGGVCGGLV